MTGCWRYCHKYGMKQMPSEWKKSILIPMLKKKDGKLCYNYHGMSLLSIPGRVLILVLLRRLETIIDPQLMEAQSERDEAQSTKSGLHARS